ncbi:hypothetical protein NDA15_002918 [Ustilago hordei]|nr:hypothetical protein NDA15_002918 [Ustilago hordei]
MKHNYPYAGQGVQQQQQAYGQPPPPAGPAPPLPSSGPPPPPPAYANYGYGSLAPGRHAPAHMNSAGAGSPQQSQWNQQQPHYLQQSGPGAPTTGHYAPLPPTQSGPYRGPHAGQAAAYSPHVPQQQQQAAQYPYQAPTLNMHSPSPAPPAYAYSPSAPQHQNLAPNNGNAQNWPGAYASGNQVGPPSKKARYQAPAVPSPVPLYRAPGVAPMAAPMGGNLAGPAAGPYGPAAANPPLQQPYAWQGPNTAPPPHRSPQPGQQGNFGRVPSGNTGRGGMSAQPSRGGKNARASSAGNGLGRGMNRNGTQTRNAALPANPNASMNAARTQNGPAPAWGPHANATSPGPAGRAGPAGSSSGPSAQLGAGRRASTASSVYSEKNSRRQGAPAVPGAGSLSKPGFSSQNMIPIDAPRGPNGARNKAVKGGNDAPSTSEKGNNAAAQIASGSEAGSKNANGSRSGTVDAIASVKDSNLGASSKRAHIDFRILGLEIKELDWSWFAPEALGKNVPGGVEVDIQQDADQVNAEANDAPAVTASQAADDDDIKRDVTIPADGNQVANANEAQSTRGDEAKDEENDEQNADPKDEAEPNSNEINDHHDEHADYDEHPLDAQGEAEDDAGGEADAQADADAETGIGDDADDDAEADANADGDAEADPDTEDDLQANGDGDVSMSQVESDSRHSVPPTPEPNGEPPNGKQAAQASNGSKTLANLRESTKVRFCFAAMSNAGPEGAPTGPKAEQIPEAAADTSTEVKVKTEDGVEAEADNVSAEGQEKAMDAPAAEAEQEKPAKEDAGARQEVKVETVADVKQDETAAGGPDADTVEEKSSEEQSAQLTEDEAADATREGVGEKEEDKKQESKAKPGNETEQQDEESATASSTGKKAKPPADLAPQAKGPPQLSLNRIFLSFAANRKRLAIDAEAVKSVRIHRSEHWIEIIINTARQNAAAGRKKGEEYLVCNKTLLEKRAKGQENYTAVTLNGIASFWTSSSSSSASFAESNEAEHLELPPFFRLPHPSPQLTILVKLDPSAPLPEPTWLRKNDVASLLANLQRSSGRSETAVSVGAAQHVWAGKIEVVDPDPPPSMGAVLYEWVKESVVGSQRERKRFVDQLLCKAKGHGVKEAKKEEEGEKERERDVRVTRSFIEIILRLIKGERVAIPPSNLNDMGGSSSAPTESSSFSRAASKAMLTTTTTYPGWIMISLLNLLLDNPATDSAEVRRQVDRMCMDIPKSSLFKGLDLTLKDGVGDGRESTAGQGGVGGSGGSKVGAGRIGGGGMGGGGKVAGVKRQYGGGGGQGGAGRQVGGGGGGRFGKRKRN